MVFSEIPRKKGNFDLLGDEFVCGVFIKEDIFNHLVPTETYEMEHLV